MKKLLIVDDNPQNLYMLQMLLSAHGFQVEVASNGAEALEKARFLLPDMIISDILMPVMDGFALCRAWKKDDLLKNIPFIFYTATYISSKDEAFALSLGADRFIVKPTEPKTFMEILWETMKNYKSDKPVTLGQPVEESEYYKNYNAAIIRKLEQKMIQLEETNRILEQDIAERKQAEEDRRKLQDQIIQAQKMESVGRLAGGIAHDFNNMLGVILGCTELSLLMLDSTHLLYNNIKEIHTAALRSSELTRQLLAFARKQPVKPKCLDLNETITIMLKMLQRIIGEDIKLLWNPAQSLWAVKMDTSQVDQILVNLCVNAKDAITRGGEIVIETKNVVLDKAFCSQTAGVMPGEYMPGEYVELSVRDNGCGMDKETLSHLFEPFFTTKIVGKGTGLGLATVYGIVKQNEGYITVTSEPNHGTTFEIFFRRYVAPLEERHTPAIDVSPTQGRKNILLVEDDPQLIKLIRMILESFGYNVFTARTPDEALRLDKDHSGEIHLLMTDLVMPGMNGIDLAKEIQKHNSHIKLLIMSGYTADIVGDKGFLEDEVHFLQKPFTMKALAAKLRELLA